MTRESSKPHEHKAGGVNISTYMQLVYINNGFNCHSNHEITAILIMSTGVIPEVTY